MFGGNNQVAYATEGSDSLGTMGLLIGSEFFGDCVDLDEGRTSMPEIDCDYEECRHRSMYHTCFLRTYKQCSSYPRKRVE
jgi:hypothetical protein